jgi:hypothetical protein
VNAPFHSALASSPCSSSNLSCTYNFTFAPTAPVFSDATDIFVFVSFDPMGASSFPTDFLFLHGGAVSHLIFYVRQHQSMDGTVRVVALRVIIPTAELPIMARQLASPDMADISGVSPR